MVPQNGFILGWIFGAFLFSINEYVHYMGSHEVSKYESHLKAKDQLTNRLLLGHTRGAFGWRFQVAALVFLWTYLNNWLKKKTTNKHLHNKQIVQIISAYRNEINWIEHSIRGATVGVWLNVFSWILERLA